MYELDARVEGLWQQGLQAYEPSELNQSAPFPSTGTLCDAQNYNNRHTQEVKKERSKKQKDWEKEEVQDGDVGWKKDGVGTSVTTFTTVKLSGDGLLAFTELGCLVGAGGDD